MSEFLSHDLKKVFHSLLVLLLSTPHLLSTNPLIHGPGSILSQDTTRDHWVNKAQLTHGLAAKKSVLLPHLHNNTMNAFFPASRLPCSERLRWGFVFIALQGKVLEIPLTINDMKVMTCKMTNRKMRRRQNQKNLSMRVWSPVMWSKSRNRFDHKYASAPKSHPHIRSISLPQNWWGTDDAPRIGNKPKTAWPVCFWRANRRV